MTRTVTPASEARARLNSISTTDAQLATFEHELQRAIQRRRDYVYMDYPMTARTQAHLEAQGYRIKLLSRRGPGTEHYQVIIP